MYVCRLSGVCPVLSATAPFISAFRPPQRSKRCSRSCLTYLCCIDALPEQTSCESWCVCTILMQVDIDCRASHSPHAQAPAASLPLARVINQRQTMHDVKAVRIRNSRLLTLCFPLATACVPAAKPSMHPLLMGRSCSL